MSLAGLGVLIIGLALLLLSLFIAKALNNLASVLDGVERTVEQLPNQLDEVLKETSDLIRHSTDTIADVNEKLNGLSPLFYIVGDVGETSRKLSSSFMDVSASFRNKTTSVDAKSKHKYLGGIYGSFALGYYWLRKRKEHKQGMNVSSLYAKGNRHANEINKIKTDVQKDIQS